jgi:general secretion pathway protein K
MTRDGQVAAACRAEEHREARQQGMAVIAALLVVGAVAAIAATMLDGQSARTQLMQSEKARVQARLVLLDRFDWARTVLRDDGLRSPITSANQSWATPVVDLRVDQGAGADAALFSGSIDDEQGKYNLRNLARAGRVDPAQQAVFERLLQALRLPPSIAADIARRMANAQPQPAGNDAQDVDATPTRSPALPPRAPGLQSLDDLAGMAGLDDPALRRLRCCVTILPERTPVNVNTAPAEVLQAVVQRLSLGRAVVLVQERDRGAYFNDAADFVNRLADHEIELPDDSVDVSSQWFSMTGGVHLGRAMLVMQALLQRDDRQATRVVWLSEANWEAN